MREEGKLKPKLSRQFSVGKSKTMLRDEFTSDVSVNLEHLEELDNVSVACPLCLRLFVRKSAIEKHLEMHIKQKRFRCLHCRKTFKTKVAVKRHVRCHLEKKTLDFNQLNNNHGQSATNANTNNVLSCIHCNKIIPSEADPKPICNSNCKVSPSKLRKYCSFTCSACTNTFVQSPILRTQMRVKTGLNRAQTARKPFRCPYCSKNFTKRSLLSKHIRTRTLEKPYKCIRCCKAFSTSKNLTVHSRSHNPHICTEQMQLPKIS